MGNPASRLLPAFFLGSFLLLPALPAAGAAVEIREYQGMKLDPYDRDYENSIKGPQTVDPKAYRLEIGGLVVSPRSLSYEEIMRLPQVRRAVTLACVEGWDETLLFEGVRLMDLLAQAAPAEKAKTVVFHAADGYSSSLPLAYVRQRDLILAAKVNGLVLDAKRGFPFQVVAESKYGYKWVRWPVRIILSDKPYQGYWESRGYGDEADLP